MAGTRSDAASGIEPRKQSEETGGRPGTASPVGRANEPAPSQRLKQAAAYARVSTELREQQESLGGQIEALRQAARAGSYDLPEEFIFVDKGYSGARLDRPGLDRLRDLVSEGAIETVLILAPDRLARHYAWQVVVIDELHRAGCEVVFLNHGFGDTPEERMLLQIQGVFAEYERALITERMRRGRLHAARQGRVNWSCGSYGYRYIRKSEASAQKLAVDESEAVVVQQMYRWLVEEQISSYTIQQRLNEQGIPTRKQSARGWAQSTVIDVLRNPMYKGEGYFNRTQQSDAKRPRGSRGLKDMRPGNLRGRTLRPREEWVSVQVPAIVDAELWALAQEQLVRNREHASRNNTRHDYLLRGLLRCGKCGRRLGGAWSRTGGRYLCSARYPRTTPWSCDGRSLSVPQAETLVWEHVCQLLSDPELLQSCYESGRGDPAVDTRQEHERHRIERRLTALKREGQRLVDAYQQEVIDLDELKQRRQRIDEHGEMLRRRIEEIDQQRRGREQELRLVQGIEAFRASVQNALLTPDFQIKQRVLQLVVDHVSVEDDQLTIRHVVPTGPVKLQTEPNLPGTLYPQKAAMR